VVEAGQSFGTLHATQVPVPLQTLPPLSVQAVPWLALLVPQVLLEQVSLLQTVPVAGQSVGALHCTHPSVALHTWLLVAQLVVVAVGQAPMPLQLVAAVKVVPLQPAATHCVVLE
jgi:hypothetical protein